MNYLKCLARHIIDQHRSLYCVYVSLHERETVLLIYIYLKYIKTDFFAPIHHYQAYFGTQGFFHKIYILRNRTIGTGGCRSSSPVRYRIKNLSSTGRVLNDGDGFIHVIFGRGLRVQDLLGHPKVPITEDSTATKRSSITVFCPSLCPPFPTRPSRP